MRAANDTATLAEDQRTWGCNVLAGATRRYSARQRFLRRSIPIEAAAPMARSPSVPGSGTELPGPPEPEPPGAGHQEGIILQVPIECAAGAPMANAAQTNKANVILCTASPKELHLVDDLGDETARIVLSALSTCRSRSSGVHAIRSRNKIVKQFDVLAAPSRRRRESLIQGDEKAIQSQRVMDNDDSARTGPPVLSMST